MERDEAEELLRTLFADPRAARRRAQDVLVPDPDPALASIGHQVVGIVLRDLGDTDACAPASCVPPCGSRGGRATAPAPPT